jgi:hypothetical protein
VRKSRAISGVLAAIVLAIIVIAAVGAYYVFTRSTGGSQTASITTCPFTTISLVSTQTTGTIPCYNIGWSTSSALTSSIPSSSTQSSTSTTTLGSSTTSTPTTTRHSKRSEELLDVRLFLRHPEPDLITFWRFHPHHRLQHGNR